MAISDIDVSSPAGSDPIAKGDDEIRKLKLDIKSSFPNVGGAVNLSHTDLNNALQTLSVSGNQLTISNGNTVTLPSSGGGELGDIYASDVIYNDTSSKLGCSNVQCAIDTNAGNIESLDSRVSSNENELSNHATAIQNNQSDISALERDMDFLLPTIHSAGYVSDSGSRTHGYGNWSSNKTGTTGRYRITLSSPRPDAIVPIVTPGWPGVSAQITKLEAYFFEVDIKNASGDNVNSPFLFECLGIYQGVVHPYA